MAQKKAKKTVRLSDVAEKAGASVSTVSLVLNGRGESLRIHKDTQQRIIQAAKALGYVTPRQRKSNEGSSTPSVGLVFLSESGKPDHEFFNDFFLHTSHEITLAGMTQLTNIGVKLSDLPHALMNGPITKADAYIFPTLHGISEEVVGALDALKKPYVFYNRQSFPRRSSVVTDNFRRGYELAHHIYDKGHKEIGYLKPHFEHNQAFEDRFLGIQKAASERGLGKMVRCLTRDLSEETIPQIAKFMESRPAMTAAIVHSQAMAWSFLDASDRVGFSVASLDHFQAIETPSHRPVVTGFRTRVKDMCREAVSLLQRQLAGDINARNSVVEVTGEYIAGETLHKCNP